MSTVGVAGNGASPGKGFWELFAPSKPSRWLFLEKKKRLETPSSGAGASSCPCAGAAPSLEGEH